MLSLPRPFEPEFLADLPYHPEVLLFDQLVGIDNELSAVHCRMPTLPDLPFTRSQRHHPRRHPQHVAGAVMIHATGMLGFVHAYYVLGLRHREGWVGYGTHIHEAVFRKLVPPGEPMDVVCRATKVRSGRGRHLVRYSFEFRHQGELSYEGDQSAMWMKVD